MDREAGCDPRAWAGSGLGAARKHEARVAPQATLSEQGPRGQQDDGETRHLPPRSGLGSHHNSLKGLETQNGAACPTPRCSSPGWVSRARTGTRETGETDVPRWRGQERGLGLPALGLEVGGHPLSLSSSRAAWKAFRKQKPHGATPS